MGVYKRETTKGQVWWYCDFYIGTRRVRQRVGASRREAQRVLRTLQTDALRGKYDHIEGMKAPQFADYAAKLVESARKDGKRSWERDKVIAEHFNQAFGSRRLTEITVLHVEAYKRQRHDEEGAAPGTVDRELAFARWLFNRAVREGKARRNPVEPSSFFHEDNKKERVLTGDEERRLLAASPPWLQDFVRFALLTGLRKTQIQTLKWSQVEKHRGRIFLPAAVCKDKRDHLLPLNESAQAIIAAQTRRGEYVFGGEKPLENVYHAFKGALEQAGLDKEIRIHDLRHSFASRVADLGADISSLQAAMQHADLKTTQRYIHPSAQAMERAVRLLDFSHQSVTIPFSEVAQEAVAVAVSGGAPIASEVGGMMNEPVLKCMGHAGKQ